MNNDAVSHTFQPEIQGLRAIAILLVVVHHWHPEWIPGGYIGVDIFFVISGYLITQLLFLEYKNKNSIDIATFYFRRLKRLAPALLVMIAGTIFVSNLLLDPPTTSKITQSTLFSATWTSNLFFIFRDQNYFDDLSGHDLFLHTWSLSVEEQFYLLWPLVILFIARNGRLKEVLFLSIISLGILLSIFWTSAHPTSAFYATPTRISEFCAGGLAYLIARNKTLSIAPQIQSWISGASSVGLLLSGYLFHTQLSYPGAWSLIPTLLTFAILLSLAEPDKSVSGTLNNAPLRWIGDRSYSIYLWHWPILALLSISNKVSGFQQEVLFVTLTLLLSIMSYGDFWCTGR